MFLSVLDYNEPIDCQNYLVLFHHFIGRFKVHGEWVTKESQISERIVSFF